MYTTEDLIKRLQKGETAEEIADSFSKALNEARVSYEKNQKSEAEKLVLAKTINDALKLYMQKYVPNVNYDLTPKDIVALLDDLAHPRNLFDLLDIFDQMKY